MKRILILLGFCGAFQLAHAQNQNPPQIQHGMVDSHNNVIATVEPGPVFYDKNHEVALRFNRDGTITNGKNETIGYLIAGSEVQDKDHNKLGVMNRDGSITDKQQKIIAYASIADGYKLEDANHVMLCRILGTEPMWVMAYYLLLHF